MISTAFRPGLHGLCSLERTEYEGVVCTASLIHALSVSGLKECDESAKGLRMIELL